MEILDYAIKMETDGEQFYRNAATAISDAGLSRILTLLADEEKKHAEVLAKLKHEGDAKIEAGLLTTNVKNVFEQLQESGAQPSADDSQLELYAKARKIEEESRNFYLQKAEETDSPEAKTILLKIADEEKIHYQMLDTIVELVSRPEPGNWLENAEWYHADEY